MSPRLDEEQFERQLNRLVDGELNGAEYRQLLESLDSAPDGWRRCALAFLESQALSRDLLGIGRDPAPRWSAMLAAANAPVPPAESATQAESDCRPPAARQGDRRTGRNFNGRSMSAFRWAALAASWLVVFGVGWGLKGSATNHGTNHGRVGSARVPDLGSRLVVDGPGLGAGGKVSRNSAPVRVPGGGLGGSAGQPAGPGTSERAKVTSDPTEQLVDTYVPPEYRLPPADIREDVRARGIDVREREMYLPLQLEDGKNYVVPVREYKVAPWQRPAY